MSDFKKSLTDQKGIVNTAEASVPGVTATI
jgi:hypothetical protein